jgi:hypothetical protein
MIPMATVPGIRKENVLVFVIANPLPTTFRFCQLGGFSAQTTPRPHALPLYLIGLHLLMPSSCGHAFSSLRPSTKLTCRYGA